MAEINIIAVISKLRPRVKQGRVVDLDELAEEIAEGSGFDVGDTRDFAYKFGRALIRHLKLGNYVKMGEIGSFRVSCDRNKKPRVNYQASKIANNELATDFRGEIVNGQNAGLDEEGLAQRWLELNPGDTVIMRDGTTRTGTTAQPA